MTNNEGNPNAQIGRNATPPPNHLRRFRLNQRLLSSFRHLIFGLLSSFFIRHSSFILPALLLTSCAVGPNYHRPPLAAPSSFRDAPPTFSTNSLADLAWWEVFQDDTLRDLIRTAFT